MRILLTAILLLASMVSFADTPTPDFEFLFNRLPGQPLARKLQLGSKVREAHNTVICIYDFATMGGGIVSPINLRSTDNLTNCTLPGKAVIRGGFIDVATALAPTSGPFITIGTGVTNSDILASTGSGSMGVGRMSLTPVMATVSTYIKIASGAGTTVNPAAVMMFVSGKALTAGHFRLFLDYEVSD